MVGGATARITGPYRDETTPGSCGSGRPLDRGRGRLGCTGRSRTRRAGSPLGHRVGILCRRRPADAPRRVRISSPCRWTMRALRAPRSSSPCRGSGTPADAVPGRHAGQPGRPRRVGPGAVACSARSCPDAAGAGYDWIGFDPRGVGASEPALSCDADYFGYDRPRLRPGDQRDRGPPGWPRRQAYAAGLRHARRRAARPPQDHRHGRATWTAIRRALGAEADQLLRLLVRHLPRPGVRHAASRPGAPDGARRQRRPAPGLVRRQPRPGRRASSSNIKIYFGWLAKHDDVVPPRHDGGARSRSCYYASSRSSRTRAGRRRRSARTSSTDVVPAGRLLRLRLGGRRRRVRRLGPRRRRGAAARRCTTRRHADGRRQRLRRSTSASQCTDAHWPQTWAQWRRDNWRVAPTGAVRHLGQRLVQRALPATGRPRRARRSPSTARGCRRSCCSSETLDAATPFAGSLEVRRRFPQLASLIEGVGGTTHAGSLFGDRCVDDAVAGYLANGRLPKRVRGNRSDRHCPPLATPNPTTPAVPRSTERGEMTREALQRMIRS